MNQFHFQKICIQNIELHAYYFYNTNKLYIFIRKETVINTLACCWWFKSVLKHKQKIHKELFNFELVIEKDRCGLLVIFINLQK